MYRSVPNLLYFCRGKSGRLHKFHQNRASDLPLRGEKFANFAILVSFAVGSSQVLPSSNVISFNPIARFLEKTKMSNFNTGVSAGSN